MKNKRTIWIAVFVVVLVAISAGVYFFDKNKAGCDNSTVSSATSTDSEFCPIKKPN